MPEWLQFLPDECKLVSALLCGAIAWLLRQSGLEREATHRTAELLEKRNAEILQLGESRYRDLLSFLAGNPQPPASSGTTKTMNGRLRRTNEN